MNDTWKDEWGVKKQVGKRRDDAGKGKIHDFIQETLQKCTKSQQQRQSKHSATKFSKARMDEAGNRYKFKQTNLVCMRHKAQKDLDFGSCTLVDSGSKSAAAFVHGEGR